MTGRAPHVLELLSNENMMILHFSGTVLALALAISFQASVNNLVDNFLVKLMNYKGNVLFLKNIWEPRPQQSCMDYV